MNRVNKKIESSVREVLSHPFIENLNNGDYTLNELRIFGEQYYLLSEAFIQFLLLGSVQIKRDFARSAFVENLFDEHGRGNIQANHRDLLKKFLYATGCNDVTSIKPLVSTSAYINGMRDLCRTGTELEVLGALGPGCESFTVEQYTLLLNGMEKNFNFSKDEIIFFTSHIIHDPRHTEDIDNIIKKLTSKDSDWDEVILGAKKSLIFEKIFWDGLYKECDRN